MKVICEKYPQLIVHDLRIRFQNGLADVRSKKAIDALRGMTDYGFSFPNDEAAGEQEAHPGRDGSDGDAKSE